MRNILLCLVLCIVSAVRAQVLGIDFGTEFWKAALISPGKNLVIVENSRSERKTLNSIAFHEGIRFFQDDSKSKRLKKPQLSYFYLNRLIRSLDTSPIPSQTSTHTHRHTHINNTYIFTQNNTEITLQQLIAMILKNIKQLASQQAGTDIRDVVLSVPSNWGFHAKMCLVNAAYLADFSVLGLITENSAAGIQFAIGRNDTDVVNFVLFNYGSYNLQISVMRVFGYFDQKKNKTIQSLEALSHLTVEDVGGLKVDQAIAQYLATEFTKKHKKDPKSTKKSQTKLLIQASQVKQTLSANKESQAYIQGLIDGIDLNIPVSRQIIDNCEHFKLFGGYLDEVIGRAGLKKEDIRLVEIIGGASRIPRVGGIVREYFQGVGGVEIGSHINGDQSVAFGAALRAANLSLTFRVKQLHFYDPMNLDTKVIISSPDKGVLLQQTLFHISSSHGSKTSLSLPHTTQDIKITLYCGQQIIKQFATKDLPDWKKKHENENITGEPNVVIEFMMSSVHIAELKDIYVNVTVNFTSFREKVEYVQEEVQEQEKKEQQKKESEKKEQEKKEKKEQNKEEKEQTQQKEEKEEKENKQDTKSQTQPQKKPQSQPQPKPKLKKTRTIKTQVPHHDLKQKKHLPNFEQTFSKYKKYSKNEIEQKRKILHSYQSHEKNLRDKAKIRNDFQSALYSLKNSFGEEYLKVFGTKEEVEELEGVVGRELEWLDENAWTATKQLFQQHFQTLSQAYHPIHNRTTEYKSRQKTFNTSLTILSQIYQKTSELLLSHTWIKQKIEAHLKKINNTAQWISEKVKKQVERDLNLDPIIYNYEIVDKVQGVRNQYYLLKMVPRPKIDDILKDFKDFRKKYEKADSDAKPEQETKEQTKSEPQPEEPTAQTQEEQPSEQEQTDQPQTQTQAEAQTQTQTQKNQDL